MGVTEESTVLSSWKDIARYLGKGVRTVQRWEKQLGLPVRRPVGASQKSAVLLHRQDVDSWLATRFAARKSAMEPLDRARNEAELVRAELQENLETARALRNTHLELTRQIAESIRVLNERCLSLATRNDQSPWRSDAYAYPGLLGNAGTAVSKQIT